MSRQHPWAVFANGGMYETLRSVQVKNSSVCAGIRCWFFPFYPVKREILLHRGITQPGRGFEVFPALGALCEALVGSSAIEIGPLVIWLQLDCLGILLDCLPELTTFSIAFCLLKKLFVETRFQLYDFLHDYSPCAMISYYY